MSHEATRLCSRSFVMYVPSSDSMLARTGGGGRVEGGEGEREGWEE